MHPLFPRRRESIPSFLPHMSFRVPRGISSPSPELPPNRQPLTQPPTQRPTKPHSISKPIPPRNSRRLPHPSRHLRLVQFALVDVDPPRVLILTCPGRNRTKRRTIQKGHLHIAGEDVVAREPPHPLNAIPWQVPPHRHRARRYCAPTASPTPPPVIIPHPSDTHPRHFRIFSVVPAKSRSP